MMWLVSPRGKKEELPAESAPELSGEDVRTKLVDVEGQRGCQTGDFIGLSDDLSGVDRIVHGAGQAVKAFSTNLHEC